MSATHPPRRAQDTSWVGLRGLLVGCCALAVGCALAQDVSLVGLSAGKALLEVDGTAPRFWSPGQLHNGVRLLSIQANTATVEVQGQQRQLSLGQAPLRSSDASTQAPLTLYAEADGHFFSNGRINNTSTRFLVDTGATAVTLSEREAKRLGLSFEQGQPVQVRTANGELVGHRIGLTSVQLGSHTQYNVLAVVMPVDMPFVLLGNSFLSRFNMLRENDRLTLKPR